ncbi:MAG TPA: hypothetical protein VGC29_10855 [Flavisolibacter sp.]
MELDIATIVFVALGVLILVIFIIARNKKDRKKLENQIKNDYKKPADREGDIDIEEEKSV